MLSKLAIFFFLTLLLTGCNLTNNPQKVYEETSEAIDCGKVSYGIQKSLNYEVAIKCLNTAFEECTKAKSFLELTSQEGGKTFYYLEIKGKKNNQCEIYTLIDSQDPFGKIGVFEHTCYEINKLYPFFSCN